MVQGDVVSMCPRFLSPAAPVVHTRHKKIRLDPATELLASEGSPMGPRWVAVGPKVCMTCHGLHVQLAQGFDGDEPPS